MYAIRIGIVGILAAVAIVLAYRPLQDRSGRKPAKVAKTDREFLKALTTLAKKYDAEGDPEAAHFFAECAVGLGSKDEKVDEIRRMTEYSVYYGKVRGGKVMEKTGAIDGELRAIARAYKKSVEDLLRDAKAGKLSDDGKKTLRECVLKHELARGASEYIRATQRINELRRGMGLKAVLWDFENSRRLILGAWYMAQTLDLHGDSSARWLASGRRTASTIPTG